MRTVALTVLFVSLLLGGPLSAQTAMQTFQSAPLEIESKAARHKFTVELALTPDQQAQGLMYRQRMEADRGMLFIFQGEQPITMWMANTYIPLDMVFIAADGRITHIAERTIPLSTATIGSEGNALAVLELNGGTAARLGLKSGDRVIYPAFAGKK